MDYYKQLKEKNLDAATNMFRGQSYPMKVI